MKYEQLKTKTELFKNYIGLLLDNGFKVYIHPNENNNIPITYIKIVKNNNIGYVEENYFFGLNFSTTHKPNSKTGTGYQTATEITKPTIEQAEQTFILKPNWAKDNNSNIIKYKNWKEYINDNSFNKSYIEVKK